MAQIRKRNGKYRAIVRRVGHPQVSKTFNRKRDAERWATDLESEVQAGAYQDQRKGKRTTLLSVLEDYKKDESPKKKGSRAEQSKINVLLKAPFADKGIALVTPQDIAAWRDARLRAGRAANTVRNDMVVLSTVFQHALLELRLVRRNVVRDVRWPPAGKGRERRLEETEEERLLAAAQPRERALLILLIETGMRLGEALSITYPGNLDLTDRIIDLQDTKNGERRVVPLSKRAVDALKTVPVNLHTKRMFPYRSDSWNHRWKRICAAAEVEGMTTHDLRHEAVSRLFERGFSAFEVAAISGHKTMAMLKRYTQLRAANLVTRLDETG